MSSYSSDSEEREWSDDDEIGSSATDDEEVTSSPVPRPPTPPPVHLPNKLCGYPPVPVIPPDAQAVWLNRPSASLPMPPPFSVNADDSASKSPVMRCLTNDQCLEPHSDGGLANMTETVGSSPAELMSDDIQSFILNKCTVMELHSHAAVSRRLRDCAIATMAKRSMIVKFELAIRYDEASDQIVHVPVMFIDDISDRSRNTSVEFSWCKTTDNCYSKECRHGSTFQKLLSFCGFARVERIELDIYSSAKPVHYYPNQFAMRSDTSECSFKECFVDELKSNSCECIKLLKVVSPRVLKLDIECCLQQSHLDDLLASLVGMAVESVIFKMSSVRYINDEQMLTLRPSSIVYYIAPFYTPVRRSRSWTPSGVSKFIEQWLQGNRVIERIVCQVVLVADGTIAPVVKFGLTLIEQLESLDQPPHMDVSTMFDDELFSRLQSILDGELDYQGRLYDVKYVIRVNANDGRALTIAISRATDDSNPSNTRAGFIYMLPSN